MIRGLNKKLSAKGFRVISGKILWHAVVVSDLTYVRVNYKWNYVCLLIDLFNREIIGFSAGTHKNAELVYDAFATIKGELNDIQMFHTDYAEEKTIPKFFL